MGEDRRGATGADRRRLTVPQAAEALGVTVDAVRGRICRGKLNSEQHAGTVYVWLDAPEEDDSRGPSATSHRPSDDQSERIDVFREQVALLREQLQAERQAHAEARRLLMAALERIPPQLEAPSEPPESLETPSDSAPNTPHLWSRRLPQCRAHGGGGGSVANTREGNDRQRYLDRCFEFLKHVATLSTAATLLILAIYREESFKERLLALTLGLLGLCLVISAFGMQIIATGSREPPPNRRAFAEDTQDAMILLITSTTGAVFSAAVIAFALAILSIPFWYATLLLGAIAVLLTVLLLFVRWRRKRQSSTNESPEEGGERSLYWQQMWG